jgi:hypothetical protein
MARPDACWATLTQSAMNLRKAAWTSKSEMQVDMPQQAFNIVAGRADLWEVV